VAIPPVVALAGYCQYVATLAPLSSGLDSGVYCWACLHNYSVAFSDFHCYWLS